MYFISQMESFYVVMKVSRVSHFAALDRVKFAPYSQLNLSESVNIIGIT